MLILLAALCLVGWLLGFVAYHTTSFAIHVLLVLAVIAVILHFARVGTPSTMRRV